MTEHNEQFESQLEELGFYRNGEPSKGMLRAEELKNARRAGVPANQIDRSFKYEAVLEGDKLGVTEIFELDGSPCIYFKSVGAEPTTEQLQDWHRAAWNHGLARMLWVSTPSHIRIFNAFAAPRDGGAGVDDPEVELFSDVAGNLERLRELRLTRDALSSGEFWSGPLGRRIDRSTRIDEQLVADLTVAATKLKQRDMEGLSAHRLLLRTIFIAYLESKEILPPALFHGLGVTCFEEVLGDAKATQTFFARMRETFNGDLFPPPPKREESLGSEGLLTEAQLEIPRCILARTDLTTFQQSLNFWRYDFDVIPIELISSIYEQFIHAADPERATRAGTHYTPVNLVDLVLSQVFDDGLFKGDSLGPDAKILDLSCGSGVFLVEALRRLVARRIASGEEHTRELVRETLYGQVFGVDIEETAVEIAAFSLCLTAFELDPEPNSSRPLRFERELKGQNLFVGDAFKPGGAFEQAPPFRDKDFSVIVGNPPWTRHKGPRSGRPGAAPAHVEYCETRVPKVTLPFRNPPDQAFIYRAADFSRPNARFGFILEGKRFFSHHPQSVQAKRELFQAFAPRIFFNLSALHREKLFPSAEQPAVAVVFENSPAKQEDSFLYVTVERDLTYREHGVLRVGPENIHRISVRLAAANQYTLKVAAWGTARDMALVERVAETHPSLVNYLRAFGLEMFQGYIPGDKSRPVPVELHGLPCLAKTKLIPFHLDTSPLPEFRERRLQWPRDPHIYRGPLLLTACGLRGNRLVAAVCNDDVVYSLSYCGIPMGRTDPKLASYLNAVLNSSFAAYFVFLTATKWGIEKYEVLPNDFLRIPVPDMATADAVAVTRVLKVEGDRPVNRIFAPAPPRRMMGRPWFPSRRSDHGEAPAAGGGMGCPDRRVAGQRPGLARLLRAPRAQPRHDARLGLQAGPPPRHRPGPARGPRRSGHRRGGADAHVPPGPAHRAPPHRDGGAGRRGRPGTDPADRGRPGVRPGDLAPRRRRARGPAVLSLPSTLRIFLAVEPADMRKGFDGLSQLVRDRIAQDPLSGHLYVFRNRRRDRIKILYWDRDGLALWYKRLEKGTFRFPEATDGHVEVTPAEMAAVLEGIDLRHARRQARFSLPAPQPA